MKILENFLTPAEVKFCLELKETRVDNVTNAHLLFRLSEFGDVGERIKQQIIGMLGPCIFGSENETVGLMTYKVGSSLPTHTDTLRTPTRSASPEAFKCNKHLVLSINIVDKYTGGVFIHNGKRCAKLFAGDAVLFDGMIPHEVTYITSGERIALLISVHLLQKTE